MSEQHCIQIGNRGLDHGSWSRPEEIVGSRPFLEINDSTKRGSDLAAQSAAALCAGIASLTENLFVNVSLLKCGLYIQVRWLLGDLGWTFSPTSQQLLSCLKWRSRNQRRRTPVQFPSPEKSGNDILFYFVLYCTKHMCTHVLLLSVRGKLEMTSSGEVYGCTVAQTTLSI